MLTTGMTIKEVVAEIKTDMVQILNMLNYRENNYKRAVLKATRFPLLFSPFYFTSKRKNEWIIIIEAPTKKAIRSDMGKITFVLLMNTNIGYYVYMPSWVNGQMHVIAYPPHFFSRFRERMNLELTGKELIAEYFSYNASYVFDIKNVIINDCEICEIAASSKHGVGLGTAMEGGVFLKTFVTYDMLKGEQIQKYTENENIRKEIHF